MKRVFTLFLTIWLCFPLSALAQATMSAGSYTLTDINFGSDVSLSVSQDSQPPEIGSQSILVSELEPRRAVIEWTTNKKSSSTVRYGKTTSYGMENGSATYEVKHKIVLAGLEPETTYHFKVISTDPFGVTGESEDKTLTTPADLGINTVKVSDIGYDRALITWKTGNLTQSRVEYGTTTAYGLSKSTTSSALSADHTVQLTGLSPGVEYHFRIVAENENGTVLRSSDQTFATIAEPRFEAVSARPVSPNEVVIDWRTNTLTSGIIKYRATTGPQVGTEQTAGSSQLAGRHTVNLKGLVGNSNYTYSLVATDELGKQVTSTQYSFDTPTDNTPPVITDLNVSVTRTGDELVLTARWKTDEPTRGEIVFGPKTRTDETINLPGSSSLVTEHSVVATGLKPGTPYGLTAFASDPSSNRSKAEISFVTPKLSKTIFQLIIDTFLSRFGWLSNLFQG